VIRKIAPKHQLLRGRQRAGRLRELDSGGIQLFVGVEM
jgi:hypothetical protein